MNVQIFVEKTSPSLCFKIFPICSTVNMGRTEYFMPIDADLLARQWVEMREEATPGAIVFRPADADLPPARGRRQLDLDPGGRARAGRPGGDDRTRFDESAGWHLSENKLVIDAGDWKGTYRIKEADGNRLVLEPAN
jgi:hypothetical protein